MYKKIIVFMLAVIATIIMLLMITDSYGTFSIRIPFISYILFLPIGFYFYNTANRGCKPLYETLILITLLSIYQSLFILGSIDPNKVNNALVQFSTTIIVNTVIAYIIYQFEHMSE